MLAPKRVTALKEVRLPYVTRGKTADRNELNVLSAGLNSCVLLLYPIKNSRDFAIQSEVKPNVIGAHTFSRALRRLLEHVSAWSFDWLSGLSGS